MRIAGCSCIRRLCSAVCRAWRLIKQEGWEHGKECCSSSPFYYAWLILHFCLPSVGNQVSTVFPHKHGGDKVIKQNPITFLLTIGSVCQWRMLLLDSYFEMGNFWGHCLLSSPPELHKMEAAWVILLLKFHSLVSTKRNSTAVVTLA